MIVKSQQEIKFHREAVLCTKLRLLVHQVLEVIIIQKEETVKSKDLKFSTY